MRSTTKNTERGITTLKYTMRSRVGGSSMSTKTIRAEVRYDLENQAQRQIRWHLDNIFYKSKQKYRNRKFVYVSNTGEYSNEYDLDHNDLMPLIKANNQDYISAMQYTNEFGEKDYFISPCTYEKNADARSLENIESWRAITVDIDDIGMDAEEYIQILEESGIFKTIPRPSYWISSGGGIYAQYLLYNVSNTEVMRRTYEKLKFKLYDVLNGDRRSKELNHLYRIPGLMNHNRGVRSYIVDFDNLIYDNPKRWYISELADEVFEYTREEYRVICRQRYIQRGIEMKERRAKERETRKKKKSLYLAADASKNEAHATGFYHTSKWRVRDIPIVVDKRVSNNESFDDMRNETLMIYALSLYYMHFDLKGISEFVHHYILKEVQKLNMKFGSQALKAKRPISIAESARKACEKLIEAKGIKEFNESNHDGIYYYNTDTIIERLKITEEEMELMGHLAYKDLRDKKVDERKREKAKKALENENGNHSRKQSREDNKEVVRKFLLKGCKQVQIVRESGLSKGYVSELVREIKEES